MKPKAGRFLIPASLAIAIVVVAFNAWLAYGAVRALLDSEELVEHTWQVILQVERIMSLVKDAETGNRGYLITGDDTYLQPYRVARRELPGELDRFQAMSADNPQQQARIVEMRARVQAKLTLLQQGIDLRRDDMTDTVQALVLSGTGKDEMDSLRAIADAMESEERGLLSVRTADAHSDSVRATTTLAFATVLDLLLILIVWRFLAKERSLRMAAEEAREGLVVAHAETAARAEEIRQLNETLEQRVNLRTAELEITNRELEAFSYSVSHDLRAPLRTIDGFSLALEEDYAEVVDDAGRDFIRRIRSGVQRMGTLIDALLQLSRIMRGEMNREMVDLSQLAESVAAGLQEEVEGPPMEFRIEPGLRASGDLKLLRVALENLMGNAVKFSSRSPSTIVEFGWDADKQARFVRDHGAGFDMHYADKLFHAFNRLHGDKDFQGSGIGLATVARVIHRHHGRIWADGLVDHGATFWFTLG